MSLICLCAVHINTIERKEYFLNMIESWYNQTNKIELHISLSAINDIDIHDTINDLIKYNLLYIYYQKEKLSLFNHYKYLLQSLKSYIDCYVIFTNGVGLWHPHRVSYFYKVIDDLPQNIW